MSPLNESKRTINNYGTPLFRFYGLTSTNISPKQRALLLTTSFYLCELDVLQDRMQDGLVRVFGQDASKTTYWYDYFMLSTDIHSYVIAWTNLDKSIKRLTNDLNDIVLQRIYKKREKWFKKMRSARNNIEHIDERAIRSPEIRHTPSIIQISGKNTASIYGQKFDIGKSGVKKIESISHEIQNWLLKHLTVDEIIIYERMKQTAKIHVTEQPD